MSADILGFLFFISIFVFFIGIVMAVIKFLKKKSLQKLKYVLIAAPILSVVSFIGFGMIYEPSPEEQAIIEQRRLEKEREKEEKEQEKLLEQEQKKLEEERKQLEQERKQLEKEQAELQKEQEEIQILAEQREKQEQEKQKEQQEQQAQKLKEQQQAKVQETETVKETQTVSLQKTENKTKEETEEEQIIAMTKEVFGEENYINVFYEPEDNFVLIKAKAKENAGSSLTAKGMLKSIHDILEEMQDMTNLNVDFNIVYDMVDSSGNVSEDIVIKATYTSETRNSINWDNYVLFENMPVIADEWWIHPAVQRALEE